MRLRLRTTARGRRAEQVQMRTLDTDDIDELVRLENRCFTSYYRQHRFDHADFSYYLRDKRTIARAAVHNRTLVGYILGIVHTGRLRHIARLHSVAVADDFRRKKIGTRLLQQFLKVATNRRCTRALLEIAAADTHGIRFFTKLGFKKLRVLPDYYGKRIDGIRMSLEL